MIQLDLENMKIGDEILWVGAGVNSKQTDPIVPSHHSRVISISNINFAVRDWRDIKSSIDATGTFEGRVTYFNDAHYVTSGAIILAKQMKGYKPPKKLRGWVLK